MPVHRKSGNTSRGKTGGSGGSGEAAGQTGSRARRVPVAHTRAVIDQSTMRDSALASGDADDAAPLDWIGPEIKSLRKARGLSLQGLSALCGKSIGFLSQLERGKSKPTVGALHDVAAALGVQVSWFFPHGDSAEPSDGGVVVRRERRRQLTFDSGIADYLLSPNLSGQLELLWSVMAPGSDSGDAYQHRGEEGGVVIKGTLELWVGDQHFLLEEGDSFTFESHTPHRYRNPGNAPAEIVWVVTPPSY